MRAWRLRLILHLQLEAFTQYRNDAYLKAGIHVLNTLYLIHPFTSLFFQLLHIQTSQK